MKIDYITKFYNLHRMQIFPAAVALASLFLIIVVIYPQTAQLLSNQKKIEEINKKTKSLETKITALESVNGDDLSRKVEFVLSSFPDNKDFGNILYILQLLTAKSGFIINAITFNNSSSKLGNLDIYSVKLEIKGPKVMISSLLNNLESSPRLVRISGIEISSNQASSATDLSLTVDAIYSALSKDPGGSDTPLAVLSQTDEDLLAKLEKLYATIPEITNQPSGPRGKANPFE